MLDSYSSASLRNDIEIGKQVVVEVGKKTYLAVTFLVYTANEREIGKLTKECKAIYQSTKRYDWIRRYVTYLVPTGKMHILEGLLPNR